MAATDHSRQVPVPFTNLMETDLVDHLERFFDANESTATISQALNIVTVISLSGLLNNGGTTDLLAKKIWQLVSYVKFSSVSV